MKFGFFEKIKQISGNETITSKEQAAFATVANKVIFSTPREIDLTRNNGREISRMIQEDFLDVAEQYHTMVKKHFDDAISNLKTALKEHLGTVQTEESEKFQESESAASFSARDLAALYEYSGWGFTPKFAIHAEANAGANPIKEFMLNCLGNAILTGADLKKRGGAPTLAVGADHPEVCVIDKEKISFLYSSGLSESVVGELTDFGSYQILRLSESSKDLQKFFLIFDFDDAVLYETLENLEVLRLMSLGEKVDNLPGTHATGMKIAEANADVLQGANWKQIQAKLFPDIVAAFTEHRVEFDTHAEDVKAGRTMILASKILSDALKKAQRETSLRDIDFNAAQVQIHDQSKEYSGSIVNFLYGDQPFSFDIPKDIASFYTTLKDNLVDDKLEPGELDRARAFIYLQIMTQISTAEEVKAYLAKVPVL